jgi:hypothetical protein
MIRRVTLNADLIWALSQVSQLSTLYAAYVLIIKGVIWRYVCFLKLRLLLLACDLGKSGGKFFYKLLNGQTHALWMDAEVAQRSAAGVAQVSPGRSASR